MYKSMYIHVPYLSINFHLDVLVSMEDLYHTELSNKQIKKKCDFIMSIGKRMSDAYNYADK